MKINSIVIYLNQREIGILFKQNPASIGDGGYQQLLVTLQKQLDPNSGKLTLSPQMQEKIARYAFNYGNGGWEDRLMSIFSRTLGKHLGRQDAA